VSAVAFNLAGQFFLTFDEQGKLQWQGEIVGQVEAGFYLCQLFSAFTGEPTNCIIRPISDMMEWRIYLSDDMWREAYDKFVVKGRR